MTRAERLVAQNHLGDDAALWKKAANLIDRPEIAQMSKWLLIKSESIGFTR